MSLKKPITIKTPVPKPVVHQCNYVIIQSKLAKFNKTQLSIVHFGPAAYLFENPDDLTQEVVNSNARQLISVDQNYIYRVHKLKGNKIMAEKDFCATEADFENPNKISNLKTATQKQLKELRVVTDYVFCSFLQTSRLNFLDPVVLSEQNEKVGQVMFYRGLVIASFQKEDSVLLKSFSIFDENEGRSKIDLNSCYFKPKSQNMKSIDFIKVPRLEWDHRQDFHTGGLTLPRKVLLAGQYAEGKPFVALIDTRPKQDQTLIKCYEGDTKIESIGYGPYDNGHVILAMSNGFIVIVSSLDL